MAAANVRVSGAPGLGEISIGGKGQAVTVASSGQFEASIAAGESALAMSGRHPWPMAWLAVALADLGKTGEADSLYFEMQARARREYVSPTLLAIGALAAVREDEVIRYAREACEIRDPCCTTFFSKYFYLSARLHRDPRFREIIAQVGPH